MSIDKRLMREAVRYCKTEGSTKEVLKQFESKYMRYASTTEEAAGLAVLLDRMQHYGEISKFCFAKGIDNETERALLKQESGMIANKISRFSVSQRYEERGLKAILRSLRIIDEYTLREREPEEDFRKELELSKRLEELYWAVVSSMKNPSP